MFSRYTDVAITAMSQLAEVYGDGTGSLTSAQMAEGRPYSQPFIAKVLTVLSQQGLVQGTSGRRGGYSLARPPGEISLLDIARCFQRTDKTSLCPFNKAECTRTVPCPLHESIVELQEQQQRFLSETRLDVFVPQPSPRERADARDGSDA